MIIRDILQQSHVAATWCVLQQDVSCSMRMVELQQKVSCSRRRVATSEYATDWLVLIDDYVAYVSSDIGNNVGMR
jgi:hypothetical protein